MLMQLTIAIGLVFILVMIAGQYSSGSHNG